MHGSTIEPDSPCPEPLFFSSDISFDLSEHSSELDSELASNASAEDSVIVEEAGVDDLVKYSSDD